jgi:hypothetical protein
VSVSRGIRALVGVGIFAYLLRAIGQAGDERNIRALAGHLGCSIEDARRLYLLARQDGYGSAYRQVFPSGHVTPKGAGERAVDLEPPTRRPRRDQPVHR